MEETRKAPYILERNMTTALKLQQGLEGALHMVYDSWLD